MLLVSDVSLNELECKHALNNSAKTELISRCLRLSRETPDLMLYRWIRCSDLIIYITFLYMKKKENLALIPYSVLIPLRTVALWESLDGAAWWEGLPPHPSHHSVHLWRGEGDVTARVFSLHITLPLTMHLLSVVNPPISPCSRRRLWLLSESWDDPLVWAASLTGWCVLSAHWSYKAVWLMDVGVSAGLGGDTGEAWNGLWTHKYFMVGRTQTEEKSTQKMELLIPWNEGNCEGLGSELQPLTWEAEMGGMPLNFWLARLEPAPGQDEFSFG